MSSVISKNIFILSYNQDLNQYFVETYLFFIDFRYLKLMQKKRLFSLVDFFNEDDTLFHTRNIILSCDSQCLERILLAYKDGIYLINLQNKNLKTSGRLHLHNTDVNILSNKDYSDYFVSGDRKGIIKVWDYELCPIMTLVGHVDAITGFAISPTTYENIYGCPTLIVSSSLDGSLRLWSLSDGTQIDHADVFNFKSFNIKPVDLILPMRNQGKEIVDIAIGSLEVVNKENKLMVETWRLHNLMRSKISFTKKIKFLKTVEIKSELHGFDTVVIIVTDSNPTLIYLYEPTSNKALAVTIIQNGAVKYTEWNWKHSILYVITDDGILTLFDTQSSPTKRITEFVYDNKENYTLDDNQYGYFIEENEAYRLQNNVHFDGALYLYDLNKDMNNNKHLFSLFIGLSDGSIGNINLRSGSVVYRTPAHISKSGSEGDLLLSSERSSCITLSTQQSCQSTVRGINKPKSIVSSILGDPHRQLLYTTGVDAIIRIWHLEFKGANCVKMSLLTTPRIFTPTRMTHQCLCIPRPMERRPATADRETLELLGSRGLLVAALENEQSAVYSLVVYHLSTGNRFDHLAEQGHSEPITSLATSPLSDDPLCKSIPGTFLICTVSELDKTGNIIIWTLAKTRSEKMSSKQIMDEPKDPLLNLICLHKVRMTSKYIELTTTNTPFNSRPIFNCQNVSISRENKIYISSNNRISILKCFDNIEENDCITNEETELDNPALKQKEMTSESIKNIDKKILDLIKYEAYETKTKEDQFYDLEKDELIKFKRIHEQNDDLTNITDSLKRKIQYSNLTAVQREIQLRKRTRFGFDPKEPKRVKNIDDNAFNNYMKKLLRHEGMSKQLVERFVECKDKKVVSEEIQNECSNLADTACAIETGDLDHLKKEKEAFDKYLKDQEDQARLKRARKAKKKKGKKKKRGKKKKGKKSGDEKEEKRIPGLNLGGDPVMPDYLKHIEEERWQEKEIQIYNKEVKRDSMDLSDPMASAREFHRLPYRRPATFFTREAIKYAEVEKCGWMPNSALIALKWPKVFEYLEQTEIMEEESKKVWQPPDLSKIEKNLVFDDLNLSEENDEDKPIFCLFDDDSAKSEADDEEPKKSFFKAKAAKKREAVEEAEKPNSLLAKAQEQKAQRETLVSSLSVESNVIEDKADTKPPLSDRPKKKVFLTEIKDTHLIKEEPKLELPVFLEPYRESSWLKETGIYEKMKRPVNWPKSPCAVNPREYILFLLNKGTFLSILTENNNEAGAGLLGFVIDMISGEGLVGKCSTAVHACLLNYLKQNYLTLRSNMLLIRTAVDLLAHLGDKSVETCSILLAFYMTISTTEEAVYKSLKDLGMKDKHCELLKEKTRFVENETHTLRNRSGNSVFALKEGEKLDSMVSIDTFVEYLSDWLTIWQQDEAPQTPKDAGKKGKNLVGILKKENTPKTREKVTFAKGVTKAEYTKGSVPSKDRKENVKPERSGVQSLTLFCVWAHKEHMKMVRKKAQEESDRLAKEYEAAMKAEVAIPDSDNLPPSGMALQRDKVILPNVNSETSSLCKLSIKSENSSMSELCKLPVIVDRLIETQKVISRVISIRDPTLPSYLQPWRMYRDLLTDQLPVKHNHLRLPRVHLGPFTRCDYTNDAFDRQFASPRHCATWHQNAWERLLLSRVFVPDLSRLLPSMRSKPKNPWLESAVFVDESLDNMAGALLMNGERGSEEEEEGEDEHEYGFMPNPVGLQSDSSEFFISNSMMNDTIVE